MFKISDFSRFTRISVKMLRHYDELGLLKPAHVDPFTGYRYYSPNQVPRLNRIIALKDMGFSLEQIGDFLTDELSLEEIRGMLKLRRAEIEQRVRQEQARLAQVETQLRRLEEEARPSPYEVILREVPPLMVAAIRQTLPDTDDPIARLFDEVEAHVAQYQARASFSPLTISYDSDFPEEQVEVEVAVPICFPIPSSERIIVRELPAVPAMACVVYEGSYEQGLSALSALSAWMEGNGYEAAGALREVYLRFSADDAARLRIPTAFLAENEKQFVTEIQLPVVKRGTDKEN